MFSTPTSLQPIPKLITKKLESHVFLPNEKEALLKVGVQIGGLEAILSQGGLHGSQQTIHLKSNDE
jgi:hypothetical protein